MKKIISIILAAALAASMTAGLSGCGGSYDGEVNVYNWGEYISNGEDGLMDIIEEFENQTNIKVNYTTYETNEELYNMLKNSNVSYDVIIPSEYMISKLIEEDMLLELDFDNIPNYEYIMDRFKKLDCDPEGKYTVCYSWGVTAMVYDTTKVSEKPTSWEALWDEDLSGQILMFNNSRDAMAISMQLCGINPSSCTTEDVDTAAEKLSEQKPLLKKYVMDQAFTEMETGQAAIAPYYAGDIITMMENNEDLDYAMPEDGANLFYDAMCIPTCSKNKENAEKFINFMQEPEVAAANFEYLNYATPNQKAYDNYIDEDAKNNELIYPSDEYLDKCYVFTNVSDEVYSYMQEQFVKIQAD
ncbi:MAG: spermidine/putrescine ABC transporter substrate-binding protein [Clostridiales bacterium]|nr:spermidine/putrescine ABC transporter substrate-binding protein [Clostridiales bacterium]